MIITTVLIVVATAYQVCDITSLGGANFNRLSTNISQGKNASDIQTMDGQQRSKMVISSGLPIVAPQSVEASQRNRLSTIVVP